MRFHRFWRFGVKMKVLQGRLLDRLERIGRRGSKG
jgi:hypothetical protein